MVVLLFFFLRRDQVEDMNSFQKLFLSIQTETTMAVSTDEPGKS